MPEAIPKRILKAMSKAIMPSFYVNDLVWEYVRGYPSWPGVIEKITPKGKYVIHFLGDYSRSEIGRNAITNFFEGFNTYMTDFGNVKLKKAVNDARIFLLSGTLTVDKCMVCMIPELKKTLKAELCTNVRSLV